ncbi:MAG: FkbM family methyltransferase [Planctomycetaceae bacterium]
MLKRLVNKCLQWLGFEIVSTSRIGSRAIRDAARVLQLLNDDAILIFDVGANDGGTAASMRQTFPGATIYCFEPFRTTFDRLSKKFRRSHGIICEQMGFSDKAGNVACVVHENSELNSVRAELNSRSSNQTPETVKLSTIDEYCYQENIERISLLKTDTEGFDLHVLRGARSMLESGKIDVIVCEVGVQRDDSRHTPLWHVSEFLQERGYRIVSIAEQMPSQTNLQMDYCNAVFALRSLLLLSSRIGRNDL